MNQHPAQDRLEECGFESRLQYVVRNERTGEAVIYNADQKEVAFSAYRGKIKFAGPGGGYSIKAEVVYSELLESSDSLPTAQDIYETAPDFIS